MSLLTSFFGTKRSASSENASAVDVVTYLASLASEPRAIDPYLDDLREITVRLKPNDTLSAVDQATLAGICQKLQTYLTEQDKLRTFGKEALQQKINQKFPKRNPAESIFWEKFPL